MVRSIGRRAAGAGAVLALVLVAAGTARAQAVTQADCDYVVGQIQQMDPWGAYNGANAALNSADAYIADVQAAYNAWAAANNPTQQQQMQAAAAFSGAADKMAVARQYMSGTASVEGANAKMANGDSEWAAGWSDYYAEFWSLSCDHFIAAHTQFHAAKNLCTSCGQKCADAQGTLSGVAAMIGYTP